MQRLTSFLLAFVLLLSNIPTAFAEGGEELPDKIDSATVWSYLDGNSDPAGDPSEEGYDRTAWTAVDFDDSAWDKASGSFGAKNGGAYDGADVQLSGCPGDETNFPTLS